MPIRLTETDKRCNVDTGYGFITRYTQSQNIFAYHTSIAHQATTLA